MNQDVICGSVSSITNELWTNELQNKNIKLTDIGDTNDPIAILIGADVAGKLVTGKKFDLKNGLTALETRLGWTVLGKLPKKYERTDTTLMFTTMCAQEANLSDLWHLDAIGIKDSIEKTDSEVKHEPARKFLISTASRNTEGRYVVRLPWVENHASVSTNYDLARNRLKKCVDKLTAQGLLEAYDKVFQEWLTEGIIEKVPDGEIENFGHYLPHRPVIKIHSTTRIRPVFDASACKKGYPSLNQCLEKGPNLIELVPSSLNRFREGEIGVVSDIKRAFLQIIINEEDRDYLRFFWFTNNEMVVLRHRRVVFGLACSPFLLAEIVELHLSTFFTEAVEERKIAEKLRTSFYVDNCVTSVDSEEELKTFVSKATAIMKAGGFELRGWENSRDSSEDEVTLVLGILWNKKRDTISINPEALNINSSDVITKRKILSVAHRVFDPIGFTCPISVFPKLLLKELWVEKIDWDMEIAKEKVDRFTNWLNDLSTLKQIELPRKLGIGEVTLHTFSDASGHAYAATVFARIESENGVEVRLLSARSRLAPERATIPRLELLAATIAVRLADTVIKSLTRRIFKKIFWSDSSTVLAWIKRGNQWGVFVRNRVNEIRALSEPDQWKHVPGDLNPADLPSRGCPTQLLRSEWWLGPAWLYKTESKWPKTNINFDEEEIESEIKRSSFIHLVKTETSSLNVKEHFSSYTKIVRFLAWMRRFFSNCKKRSEKNRGEDRGTSESNSVTYLPKLEWKRLRLTFTEIKAAETNLLKHLQSQMFRGATKEKLSSFKTMKDENGLYVLKTKIFNRKDDFNFLCPILLDDNNDIIYLLVREIHESMGHAGGKIVMTHLRERFWIISLRKIIKSVISNCIVCKRQKVKRIESEAPPLPPNRVRDATVFEIVGVDFAGPLILRGGGKGWVCIFTCAVFRAVHFELASTLSTEGFLECLRRFIARRGRPRTLYSDNGTNFTGAANALNKLDWEKIAKRSTAIQIEWYFNPPAVPWWGGWWERLIGILKTLLRKMLGKASLSYENLNTFLCDAEAIINARSLTYISEDPDDLKPLSPSLFLLENREYGVPDCDMLSRVKLKEKFKARQKLLEDLRRRFRTEYLGQLLLRNGKKSELRKLKIGDVVLIGDDIHKRIDWPLARIVDVIAGRDGQERVVILKTKNGLLKRPVQRIYPLEIAHNGNDSENLCKKLYSKRDNESNKENEGNNKIVTTRSGRIVNKPNRLAYSKES